MRPVRWTTMNRASFDVDRRRPDRSASEQAGDKLRMAAASTLSREQNSACRLYLGCRIRKLAAPVSADRQR